MTPIDPIAQLVSELRSHGRPSLPWVVRWSEGGREPVLAAWEASEDICAMTALVSPRLANGAALFIRVATREYARIVIENIRRQWTPPTLTELIAAHAPGLRSR